MASQYKTEEEMLKKYSPDEIKGNIQRYVQLCDKVKDILDPDHYFYPGDIFYHPDIGINEVDRDCGTGEFYCKDPQLITCKIKSRECVWLPSEEQLKNLDSNIKLISVSFEQFLDDDRGIFEDRAGSKPKSIFITSEEKWISYYMFKHHRRIWIWSTEKKDWVETDLA